MDSPTWAMRRPVHSYDERLLPFPGVPARQSAQRGRDDVLCNLGAYHRGGRTIEGELDRMQACLDTLRDDVHNFPFPGVDSDEPRSAA